MRNRSYLILVMLLVASIAMGQAWMGELDKHADKPISEINLNMEKYFDEVGRTRENKYHKYQRWYDYASNHQNSEGYIFNHSVENQQLLKTMNAQVEKYALDTINEQRHYHGGWSSVNPDNFVPPAAVTPTMGRINCVAKPTPTSSIIYAGTATGGVWRSYNDGASWEPLWDGMVQTGVSSIVIDYTNPNHIVALTGDADSRFIPTQGVYHSYNGGDTWSLVHAFQINYQNYGYKIIQSKANEYEYYMCLSGGGSSILKINLVDGVINQGSPFGTVFDLEYQTNDDNLLWAASSSGLFQKVNDGFSWNEVNHPNLPTGTVTRSAVAMAPSNENVLYYAVANRDQNDVDPFYGLYKSTNKGQSWDVMYDTTDANFMTYQCGYNFTLDVDPNDENRVYIGTGYLHGSTMVNGEMVFEEIRDYIHSDIHNSYHIGDNHYVCTDGGISVKTPNDTEYYGINNGLLCTQFYDMDIYGSTIIGGVQDNGTMVWNIGDADGIRRLGSDGLDCMIDPSNPNIMYASAQDVKVRSTDGMVTYTDLFSAEWHDPMTFAVDDPNKVIIHSRDELKVSYDSGISFTTSFDVFDASLNVNAISQCAADPNVLYLAKGDSLARTENFNDNPNTVEWTKRRTYFGDQGRGLLVHPDSCNVVFLTRKGYSQNQISKSTDGGVTFSSYSEGISNLPVYCIYYDHVNGNGYYIGTELGVYYRRTGMDEWIPFSTYLPRVPVYDLKVNNNYVYAATYGRGVWRSPRYRACSTNLLLLATNDPTAGANSGKQIHKASNFIFSDRIIRGRSGTDVLYQAGNYIDLVPGFHAKFDNLFVARAAGCLE